MKRINVVGLCLIAVFAFSAVVVASASAAEPQYMACKKAEKVNKKYTGGFNDKACTAVNGAGEGKYAASPLSLPTSLEGKSKTSTLYYSSGGVIKYEIVCKKDKVKGEITEPSLFEGTITFESCEVLNEITKVNAKCSASLAVPYLGLLRGETVPATSHPGITYLLEAPAYSCGGATFEVVTAFPFVTGEVNPTSKGEFGVFTVNKATGEQSLEGWIEEGAPSHWAPIEAEVTAGATTETLKVGLETTEPIGPKKGVVIR